MTQQANPPRRSPVAPVSQMSGKMWMEYGKVTNENGKFFQVAWFPNLDRLQWQRERKQQLGAS